MSRKRRKRARVLTDRAVDEPAAEAPRVRRHRPLLRAVLANGWILAGVFLLGWSAGLAIGGIYLETLLVSIGLAIAVRVARRGAVIADQGTARDVTRETVIAGFALGAFGLAFIVSILRQQTFEAIWAVWSTDLTLVIAGALLAAAIEYAFVQRALGVEPDAWVRRRVDRQQKAMLALLLLLLVVPWSVLVVGESGMIVTLFVLKALLDAWTAGLEGAEEDAV